MFWFFISSSYFLNNNNNITWCGYSLVDLPHKQPSDLPSMLGALDPVSSRSHSTSGNRTQQDQPEDIRRTGPWQNGSTVLWGLWVIVNSPDLVPQKSCGVLQNWYHRYHLDITPYYQCVCNYTRKWSNSIQIESTKWRKFRSVLFPNKTFQYLFRNVSNDMQKHLSDIQCTYSVIFIYKSEYMLTL